MQNVKKRRKGDRQKVWEFMRRNKIFSVQDIMIIFGIKENTLRVYIKQLTFFGYLQKVNTKGSFLNQSYRLIKNSGVLAPKWVDKTHTLIDLNLLSKTRDTSMKIPVEDNSKTHLEPISEMDYAEGRIIKVLETEINGIGGNELKNRCGLSPLSFHKAIESLCEKEEVVCEDCIYHRRKI